MNSHEFRRQIEDLDDLTPAQAIARSRVGAELGAEQTLGLAVADDHLGCAGRRIIRQLRRDRRSRQRESRKGSREWVRHLRNPSSKPPRRRWYEYGKKDIPMMRGLSRWQLPILTVADRSGSRRFRRISGRSKGTIQMTLSPIIARDAALCTDGLARYAACVQSCGTEHFIIKTKPGQKAASAAQYIQNINSLYSR